MSQEEIDAMVASGTGSGGETPAAPAQEAAPAPAPAPPQEAAPAPISAAPGSAFAAAALGAPSPPPVAAGAAAADADQRLAGLEATVAQLAQADTQALAQQVAALSARLEELIQYLPNTMGYGVRASFVCGSCEAEGLVGSRVTCTQCGTETWVGWWPEAA